MDSNIALLEFLLLLSALVAMLVRRLHLPYSVGLVLAGISFSFLASSRFPDSPLNTTYFCHRSFSRQRFTCGGTKYAEISP
jgi:monovalent cation:H+ antiporter, CPA1 family